MILEEYDENLHIRNEKEISYEEGLEQGVRQGIQQGVRQGIQQGVRQGIDLLDGVIQRLRSGESSEDIMKSGVDKRTIELASKYA